MQNKATNDVALIEAVVRRQFEALNWSPGGGPDEDAFARNFLPGASLFPSARPARPQTVEAFVERMKGLASSTLPSFREHVLGTKIHVFGSVAVAVAACEMVENEKETSRGVEMLLLVKTEGTWRIVSQAWDGETPDRRIPPDLLEGGR